MRNLKRNIKNAISIILIILLCGAMFFTVTYAKNNRTQNKKNEMSQNGGTPPEMPSGNNSNKGTPPEKPSGDDNNIGEPLTKPGENNTNSNTNMELVEEVNNVVENKVENTVVNENEVVESESTKKEEPKAVQEPAKQEIKSNNESEVESEDDEQKAINIVKKDWGSDEGVVFTLESISSNGNYIISVRDTESRNAVAWYTVNPKTGEFSN